MSDLGKVYCPTGCGRTVAPGKLMCRACWREVPSDVQREVNRTYRRVNELSLFTEEGQTARREYREARDRAIGAVA